MLKTMTKQVTSVKDGKQAWFKRYRKVLFVVIGAAVVVAVLFYAHARYFSNPALEVAKPLERALVEAGAVKKCSREDSGRGWDNNEPWVKVMYEVPGNQQQAAEIVKQITKSAGYLLQESTGPVNREDNLHFEDRLSLQSSFPELEDDSIDLLVTLYGSSTHTGGDDPFCTITKRANPPLDRTTVVMTINLPARKQ